MTEETKPAVPYWHVYVDDGGISRHDRFELGAFELKGINPAVEPQWNDNMETSEAGVTFAALPVGWIGEWHENRKPQWIAILTSRWFVDTMDGRQVETDPGELMMGEDQGTKGGKGRWSGIVGDRPCTTSVNRHRSRHRAGGRPAWAVPIGPSPVPVRSITNGRAL